MRTALKVRWQTYLMGLDCPDSVSLWALCIWGWSGELWLVYKLFSWVTS